MIMLGNVKNIKEEGIIIHSTDFREIDKKVDILFKSYGVVTAIAYGAKKSKKRFGGNLDPFNIVIFEISKSKQGFFIKEATIKKMYMDFRKRLLPLGILFNISKLLTSTPIQVHKKIYEVLSKILEKLEIEKEEQVIKYYIFFLVYFLKKEGILSLPYCSVCTKKEISFLINTGEHLEFLCNSCKTHNDQALTDSTRDDFKFLVICLRNDKRFNEINLPYQIYENIEKILHDYIKKHFGISLPNLKLFS